MKNKHKAILNKKFPAFLGIAIFVGSIVVLGWLSANTILFGTKASIGSVPKNIQVTNVTNTSFTVTFITDAQALGSMTYGTDAKMGQVALDDRDSSGGQPTEYHVHSITAKQLTPATKYFFALVSGDNTALDNNQPFQVMTTSASGASPIASQSATLIGKITLNDGTIPTEGIIYASTDSSQVMSGLLATDGSYNVALTNLYTADLTSLVQLTPTTIIHLTVSNGTLQSTASVLANQTNPVPLIVLGNNYDFTINDQPILPTGIASSSGQIAKLPILQDTTPASSPQILSPGPQEKLNDQQPMFTGKAVANASVQITIHSAQEIATTVQADANGNWQFRPPVPLDPGNHTITIVSQDINGAMQTVMQSFTVYASGSQFIEPSVSPSPTATPSATPAILPTPTTEITATPSATPTLIPSPTIITTSITPAPIVTGPLPKTGSSSVVVGIIAALSAISIGTFLFVFTIL